MNEVYKHLGVPYRRNNHPEGSALRNYPYELDCCALVRVSIQAIEQELGFKLGLWNQAYFFDVLPRTDNTAKAQRGDLIIY